MYHDMSPLLETISPSRTHSQAPALIRRIMQAPSAAFSSDPSPLYGWHSGPGGGAPARDAHGRLIADIRGLRGDSLTPVMRDPSGSKREYAQALKELAGQQGRQRLDVTTWGNGVHVLPLGSGRPAPLPPLWWPSPPPTERRGEGGGGAGGFELQFPFQREDRGGGGAPILDP